MTPDQTEAQATGAPTESVNISLVAQDLAFNRDRISVPVAARVRIEFENRDEGVPHNFAVYENEAADNPLFIGEIVTGAASITYVFQAPTYRGDFFFRCDVHPTMMRGRFVTE